MSKSIHQSIGMNRFGFLKKKRCQNIENFGLDGSQEFIFNDFYKINNIVPGRIVGIRKLL